MKNLSPPYGHRSGYWWSISLAVLLFALFTACEEKVEITPESVNDITYNHAADLYVGNFLVNDNCAGTAASYEISIWRPEGFTNKVIISNFANLRINVEATATVSALKIPLQQFDLYGESLEIGEGIGARNGSELWVTYAVYRGKEVQTCRLQTPPN